MTGQRWRAPLASILVVLGCLLAPVAVVGIWAGNQISDTNRYVQTVTPLAGDPTVQAAVADRVTTAIMQRVNVTSLADQGAAAVESHGLPGFIGSALTGSSGPLTSGVRTLVHAEAVKVTQSDAFRKAWVIGNRAVHTQLTAILSGNGSAVLKVQGDSVSIDLGSVVSILKQRLPASDKSLADAIPNVHPTLRLFRSADLVKAQTSYTWLNRLKWILPPLSLLLIAIGVYVAKGRRRALAGAGLGLAMAMLTLGLALPAVRTVIVNHAAHNGLVPAVTHDVFDTLTRFLRDGLRTLLVVGLAVTTGAFLAGPSKAATATRSTLRRAIGRPRTPDERTGPALPS